MWTQVKVTAPEQQIFQRITVTENSDYVDLTGVTLQKGDVCKVEVVAKNAYTSNIDLRIYINGDENDAHYYHQYLVASGTSTSAGNSNNSSFLTLSAGERGVAELTLALDPDGYFKWLTSGTEKTSTDVNLVLTAGSKDGTVDEVTSIRIRSTAAGGIAAGTVITIMKMVQ